MAEAGATILTVTVDSRSESKFWFVVWLLFMALKEGKGRGKGGRGWERVGYNNNHCLLQWAVVGYRNGHQNMERTYKSHHHYHHHHYGVHTPPLIIHTQDTRTYARTHTPVMTAVLPHAPKAGTLFMAATQITTIKQVKLVALLLRCPPPPLSL